MIINFRDRKSGKILKLDLLRNPILLMLYIMFFEFCVAKLMPQQIYAVVPILEHVVSGAQRFLPILNNIGPHNVLWPDAARCYVLLSLAFLPVKSVLVYKWVNSDKETIYRHLVVPPLTNTNPAGGDNFLTEPIRVENEQEANSKPRSLFSRLFVSTMILLLTASGVIASVDGFNTPPGSELLERLVCSQLWFEYTFSALFFVSILIAVSACIIRDTHVLLVAKRYDA